MKTRRIVAVLACHNRCELTLAALEALFDQHDLPDIELSAVLVDDGSTDGTAAAVEACFPRVEVLRSDGNLWWAGAMRMATAHAAASRPDFLLWLNDDVRLTPDAVCRLVDGHAQVLHDTGRAPIIVGTTRDPETGYPSYGGQRRTGLHPLSLSLVAPENRPVPCETFQGNVVLVPTTVHALLGGIDAAFVGVQGMADTAFGLRAFRLGVPIWVAAGLVGMCAPNRRVAAWQDASVGLCNRLRAIAGPRGVPARAWAASLRASGSARWPVWFLYRYVRCVWQAVRVRRQMQRPKVVLLEGLVAHYREPLWRYLRSVLDVDLTIFRSNGDHAAQPMQRALGHASYQIQKNNVLWPDGSGRMLWTGGSGAALRGRFDIVLAGLHVHEVSLWLLLFRRLLLGRPLIVLSGHCRFGPAGSMWGHLRVWMRKTMARYADAIVVYTPSGIQACLDVGLKAQKLFLFRNTLDVDELRGARSAVAPQHLNAAREKLALADGMPVFLFISRLYAAKRADVVIDAVRLANQQGVSCRLLVVGDGPERAALAKRAAEDPAIAFLAAIYDEGELAPLFSIATAVVIPDAAGLSVVHAFAHGVPVIACADGVAHGPEIDYVQPEENGLFAEHTRPETLAAVLMRIAADPALAQRLAAGATATADGLSIAASAAAFRAALRYAAGQAP
jgi:GT2 family glycosyltransferase/glycosyltransferase involved in cell wall biosynthesis